MKRDAPTRRGRVVAGVVKSTRHNAGGALRLSELAQHSVYRVESSVNLFPDLKVERNKRVSADGIEPAPLDTRERMGSPFIDVTRLSTATTSPAGRRGEEKNAQGHLGNHKGEIDLL